MTAPEGPVPVHPKRAWWIPLLGVGSLGTGGLQALAGLALIGVGLSAPGAARAGFLLAGACWLVPGVILAASGLAVAGGWRSARLLCLLAVAAAAAGIGAVAVQRRMLPPAVADAGEWALDHPEAPESLKKTFNDTAGGRGRETLRALREPEVAEAAAPLYVGYCCCPFPWYLLVLAAGTSPQLSTFRQGRDGGTATKVES